MVVLKSVLVQYAGRIVGLLVSLVSLGLLTRYLGVEGYGAYATVIAIAGTVVTLSDFGFFWSTIHHLNDQEDRLRVLKEIAALKFLLTALLLIVGLLFVKFGGYPAVIFESYLILALFVFASSLNNILIAVYQTEYRMGYPTATDVAARLVGLIFIGAGIYLKQGLIWFIVGVSAAAVLNILLNWGGLRSIIGWVVPQFRHIRWSQYYGSVLLIGLIFSFSVLYYRLDVLLLSWLRQEADVGIYAVSSKIVEVVEMVNSLFVGALFPILVSSFALDREKFKYYVSRSILVLAAFGLVIPVYGIWFVRDAVAFIGGESFVGASTVGYAGAAVGAPSTLAILLVFVGLTYLGSSFTSALLAAKRLKWLLVLNIVAALLNALLNLYLIPQYSYLAAAVVAVATQLLVLLGAAVYFCRAYRFKIPWGSLGKIVLALLPGLLYLTVAPNWPWLVNLAVALALYGLATALLLKEVRAVLVTVVTRRPGLQNE